MEATQEKFYLAKGKNQVFVNNYRKLSKHQMTAIRSLFSQYVCKSPGVIINYPHGSSQVKVVVFFLNAIKQLLAPHPVLILSHADNMKHWTKYLQRYSDFGDEVIIEESNPCKLKLIYLNTHESGMKLCNSRKWSTIVVDDDTHNKNILQTKMDTEFKIWITSVDMKESLKTFSLLYKWLHPKEAFDVAEFVADKNNLRDVINKAIMWDVFSRDIVIKSDDAVEKIFNEQSEAVPKLVKTPMKNKDASGTKTKRTKRKIENLSTNSFPYDHISDEELSYQNHPTTVKQQKSVAANNETLDTQEDSSEMNLHFDDSVGECSLSLVKPVNVPPENRVQLETKDGDKDDLETTVKKDIVADLENNYTDEKNKVMECDINKVDVKETKTVNISFNTEINYSNNGPNEGTDHHIEIVENKNKLKTQFNGETENITAANKITENIFETKVSSAMIEVKLDDDFDSDTNEMEDEVFKKYKGSLLDTMFNF